MEYLPKLFAKKFQGKHQHAIFKLFGLMFLVFIFSQLAIGLSQFLSEVVFFAGGAAVFVVMMGFASARYFEESEESSSFFPFLTPLYASLVFNKLQKVWKSIYHILFLIVFHVFLLFACVTVLFPFFGKSVW